ncbi:MAG: NAD kinase [Marinilabiliales bacterium]|nr:MAG: NAD kinase [Marinilabiliales bacterium]
MKIAIYGKNFDPSFNSYAELFFNCLKRNGIDYIVYEEFAQFIYRSTNLKLRNKGQFKSRNDLNSDIDLVISIGGDGTFLESAAMVVESGIPVLGINSGRLGFLAAVAREKTEEAVKALVNSDFDIEKRSALEMFVDGKKPDFSSFALNEITVFKKDYSSMITVNTFLNEEFLNSYWSDGLLVSTPTGSTAYSLSVGGPIILPGTENLIISPIAPHSLTVRPIVVPDHFTVKLDVETRSNEFMVSLDHKSYVMSAGQEIRINKAEQYVKVVRLPDFDFFSTLRNKLMWGIDQRNK